MKLTLNPADPESIAFELHRAVKKSGLTHKEIVDKLGEKYGVRISPSGLNKNIWRGSLRLNRALQILDVCGAEGIEIVD